MPAIIKLIKISKFPVLLVALDIWDKKLMALKFCCESVEFKKVHPLTVKNHLKSVLEREKVKCAPEVIYFIAKNSDGDLRAALNDLDVLIRGKKEITKEDLKFIEERPKESRIFSTIQQIFRADSAKSAKELFEAGDLDFETLKLWLDENIANEYHNPEEIAAAYDAASRSDVFRGRILRRQEWSLYKYVLDLEIAGISAAKRAPSNSFTRYNPPSKINALFRTKAERALLKSVALKIAKKSHTSSHIAQQTYIPMLKIALKHGKYGKQLAEQLALEPEEVAFLVK